MIINITGLIVVINQLLNCVQLFVTPWTGACQAPLFSNISQSLLKFVLIELVMLSNHHILCRRLLLLPSVFLRIGVFSTELALASGSQSIEASASTTVLPMNIWGQFPSGLTGLISLQSKGLLRVFSSTMI